MGVAHSYCNKLLCVANQTTYFIIPVTQRLVSSEAVSVVAALITTPKVDNIVV